MMHAPTSQGYPALLHATPCAPSARCARWLSCGTRSVRGRFRCSAEKQGRTAHHSLSPLPILLAAAYATEAWPRRAPHAGRPRAPSRRPQLLHAGSCWRNREGSFWCATRHTLRCWRAGVVPFVSISRLRLASPKRHPPSFTLLSRLPRV